MSPLGFLLCLLLIGLSGFMSGSEVALFSLSRFQLRSMKERSKGVYRRIKHLLGDPGGLLITILVTNEVLNVSLSTLITDAITEDWGEHLRSKLPGQLPGWLVHSLLGVAITAPVVLFLCEATPKVIGVKANQAIATLSIGPLTFIYNLLKPVRIIAKRVLALFSQLIGGKQQAQSFDTESTSKRLREEEFLVMVEEGHKEGAIRETELELIRNVFELDDTNVSEVFTPMSQIFTLSSTTTVKNAIVALRDQSFSRIPVIGANRNHIVGVLHKKDLLIAKLDPETLNSTLVSLMRKPVVVNSTMRLSSLFRRLKQNRIHMAVVESTPGRALGIVTMSDVLDALLEDVLVPEDDQEEGA